MIEYQERVPANLPRVAVDIHANFKRLVEEEDTDRDKKITVDDYRVLDEDRGDKRFWLMGIDGEKYEVIGTVRLSHLLQELKLMMDEGKSVAEIDFARIFTCDLKRKLSGMISAILSPYFTKKPVSTSLLLEVPTRSILYSSA